MTSPSDKARPIAGSYSAPSILSIVLVSKPLGGSGMTPPVTIPGIV